MVSNSCIFPDKKIPIYIKLGVELFLVEVFLFMNSINNYIIDALASLTHSLTDISKFLGTSKNGGNLRFCILVGLPTDKMEKTKICLSKYKYIKK